MGIFSKLLAKKNVENNVYKSRSQEFKYDYTIQTWQKDFVIHDIQILNSLLQTNECTKQLHLDIKNIWSSSYIRYTPFTEKTKKISKYPCMLYVSNSVFGGYSATLYYDCNDNICKGTISTGGKSSYSIDYKRQDDSLIITKVLVSDKNGNYEKIYHLQKDGTAIKK